MATNKAAGDAINRALRRAAGRLPEPEQVATPDQVAAARETAGLLGISLDEALRLLCYGEQPAPAPLTTAHAGEGQTSGLPRDPGAEMNRAIRKAAGREW